MNDSQHTRVAVELSAREKELLARPSLNRGYVPQGEDVEPEHAPTGAASASFPTQGNDESEDRDPDFHS